MAKAAGDRAAIFGIRHHGPGSARSLLAALDALDPAIVLIEGPQDGSDVIVYAGSAAMTPPVALLVHSQDDPGNASFYPFAEYSPEWQAMRWAIARGRPVRFIDLPAANRLAIVAERKAAAEAAASAAAAATGDDAEPDEHQDVAADSSAEPTATGEPGTAVPDANETAASIRRDPLAYLADIAGYSDSEAWWNALIEQSTHAPGIFAAIETAMTELRAHTDTSPFMPIEERQLEDQREAHMRLAVAAALKETEGKVAVVCGAWHVPALRRKSHAVEDKALLKSLPKIKVTATWVPWSQSRLAAASGYGAGVSSPGWYAHLWQQMMANGTAGNLSGRAFTARWQARVAALLRKQGLGTSTASVIEAARLAETLASLRDLALPGLDEMREASLATLCMGEVAPWKIIEAELVIGRAIGEIDESVPQMPLAADLARWQKKLKLKPEALDSDLSLDLRSEAGLAKSALLHRLNLIKVPWGRPMGSGRSRGTFRENWKLRWEPEFSVRLAEALVYGTTVEQAAGNGAIAAARQAATLGAVSDTVKGCLFAGLDDAARVTISILQTRAAATSDIAALAGAVPPLAVILRYGTARAMPEDALRLLVTSLTEAVCAGLGHACRNLQREEATALCEHLRALNEATGLIGEEGLSGSWRTALQRLADDSGAHALLRGVAVRVLYELNTLDANATGTYLSRALSRSVEPMQAGDWLAGFLGNSAGQVLLADTALLAMIDTWICELGEDDFMPILPMLRRAFSALDRAERRRLLDELGRAPVNATSGGTSEGAAASASAPGFAAALPLLLEILGIAGSEVKS